MLSENEFTSEDIEIYQITFISSGLNIDQEIIIPRVSFDIDSVIAGLNNGDLTTTLDYDTRSEEQSIRDNDGNTVAVIINQKVTVTDEGFKNFNEIKD